MLYPRLYRKNQIVLELFCNMLKIKPPLMSWPKFKETECPPLETSRFPSSSALVVAVAETIIPIRTSYGRNNIVRIGSPVIYKGKSYC